MHGLGVKVCEWLSRPHIEGFATRQTLFDWLLRGIDLNG